MKRYAAIMVLIGLVLLGCSDKTKAYGDKVYNGKAEVYYDEGADRTIAEQVLNQLIKLHWLDSKRHGTARIIKDESGEFILQIGILNSELDETLKSEDRINYLKRIKKALVEDVFNGQSIQMHICNRRLEVKKKI